MNLINGKLLADKIKDKIAQEVWQFCQDEPTARRPELAIILVGERADSALYVRLKEKAAKEVGIDTHLYKLEADAGEQPEHLDADETVKTINPTKDVDGFQPNNIRKLETCDLKLGTCVVSPVFQSILACLQEINFDLNHKQVAIVAKPGIFTDSLDKLLEHSGAAVLMVEPNEVGIKTAAADLIISAVGQADLINADDIKDGAVLIDVGICKDATGKTCGDVNAASVKDKAAWLTPVPGGIGPLTIAFALKNTLNFYKVKNQKAKGKD
jgi:methylenetetrahydrofolate dehydrogenase (NADP+)/methenyltetrahydrofolate cyclohydrolase